jgi:formylglycine-generating enzyme required for sulfatase activity
VIRAIHAATARPDVPLPKTDPAKAAEAVAQPVAPAPLPLAPAASAEPQAVEPPAAEPAAPDVAIVVPQALDVAPLPPAAAAPPPDASPEPVVVQAVEPEPVAPAVIPSATPSASSVVETEVVTGASEATSTEIVEPAPAATVEPAVDPAPVQVAVAAPVPSASVSFANVNGQVFRDCETCPDVVVVMPPRPATGGETLIQPFEFPDLPAFAIGRLEVTFDDWSRCVSGGGCQEEPSDNNWGRATRPVINVSFNQITEQYLPWLSKQAQANYRLPTAAEWDFAAAGSFAIPAQALTAATRGNVCQSANFADSAAPTAGDIPCADGFPATSPAGSLLPNGLGLHDMRGNVWEWTSDCWTPGFTYKAKASETDCRRRMLRGGSWSSRAVLATEPLRGWEDASKSKNAIGFRVLRTLP